MQNFRWGVGAAIAAIFISVALGILFHVNPVHIMIRALIFGAVFFGLGFGLRFAINSFLPEILYANEEGASDVDHQGEHIDITLDSMGEYAVPELFKTDDEEEMGNIEDLISGAFRPGFTSDRQESKPGTSDSLDGKSDSRYNDVGFFNELEAEVPEADTSSGGSLDSTYQGFTPIPIEEGDSFQDLSVFQKPENAVPVAKQAPSQEQFTPSISDGDTGLGGLPDLDMMARAFSSFGAADTPSSGPAAPVSSAPPPGVLAEDEPDRSQYKGNKPQALQGDFEAKDIARGLSTLLSKDK